MVYDLIYAIFFGDAAGETPSKYDDFRAKETKMYRARAFLEALYEDMRMLETARQAAWEAKL